MAGWYIFRGSIEIDSFLTTENFDVLMEGLGEGEISKEGKTDVVSFDKADVPQEASTLVVVEEVK